MVTLRFFGNVFLDVPLQLKDGTIEMKQLKLSKQEMGGKIFYTGVFAEPLNKNSDKLTEMEQERIVLKGNVTTKF